MLLSVSRSYCSNPRMRIRQLAAVSEDAFTTQSSWCRRVFAFFFPPYLGRPSEFLFLRTWRSHTYRNSTKYDHSRDTNRPQNGVGKSIHPEADQTNCQIQLGLEGLSSWQSRRSPAGCCKLKQAGATLLGEACSAKQVRATSRQGQLASTRNAGPRYIFFLRT